MFKSTTFQPVRPGEDFGRWWYHLNNSGRQWFQCNYCKVYFVGPSPYQRQPITEGDAARSHMATCPDRPPGKPLTDLERAALAKSGW